MKGLYEERGQKGLMEREEWTWFYLGFFFFIVVVRDLDFG
jgi:hypothetical protein